MKIKLTDPLKQDLPATGWGKILGATPVVLTVIATLLAGLASSEMTRAQYERSLAAQQQSKAGDQWNYFQGKKLRGALQRMTADVLENTAEVRPLTVAALRRGLEGSPAAATLSTPAGEAAMTALGGGALPAWPAAPAPDPALQTALQASASGRPEAELAVQLIPVTDAALEQALQAAATEAQAFDAAFKPVFQTVDTFEKAMTEPALKRDLVAARLQLQARRYDDEAAINQAIGSLRDLQVRKSNLAAERFHRRSGRFFFGMLAAQLGVILSTQAQAAQRRCRLWGVAAGAGAVAITFAAYVYWFI